MVVGIGLSSFPKMAPHGQQKELIFSQVKSSLSEATTGLLPWIVGKRLVHRLW